MEFGFCNARHDQGGRHAAGFATTGEALALTKNAQTGFQIGRGRKNHRQRIDFSRLNLLDDGVLALGGEPADEQRAGPIQAVVA